MNKNKPNKQIEPWREEFRKKFADPVKTLDHKCEAEVVESFVWRDRIERFIAKALLQAKAEGKEEGKQEVLADVVDTWLRKNEEKWVEEKKLAKLSNTEEELPCLEHDTCRFEGKLDAYLHSNMEGGGKNES